MLGFSPGNHEVDILPSEASENGEVDWSSKMFSFEVTPFGIGFLKIRCNPVITIAACILLWGFVAWAMITCQDPDSETCARIHLESAKLWITSTWTWLYMGTQAVWTVFLLWLYLSKYGDIKMGKDDEDPEFSLGSWFAMLFACGVGIGLFYFGVAEPIWHYEPCYGSPFAGARRFNEDGSPVPGTGECHGARWSEMEDNERAQWSMLITYFHWGFHAWVVYAILGMLLGLLCYRSNLPMNMKSTFYPLLGDRVFGPLGDVIDVISIVATVAGVCTSLGLGAMQLNAGLNRYFPGFEVSENSQVLLIWVITAIATLSVVSGLKVGVKILSEICFMVGNVLMLLTIFADDTWYLLNLYTQNLGVYFQWILKLQTWTDAFEQLNGGGSPDATGAPAGWMDEWTIFYWGWWISWAPFCGIFIAKISRGRTIRQFIMGVMTAPCVYTFLWLTIFGGSALRVEREAALEGITCDSMKDLKVPDPGQKLRLSCRGTNDMWFDLMDQYEGIGPLLTFLSLIGITLYFVTSSDSGSLVVDSLADNGTQEPTIVTRVFWAFTEGATATALLMSGGDHALKSLQTASIITGLIYTVVMCYMMMSLYKYVAKEKGVLKHYGWEQWKLPLIQMFHRPDFAAVPAHLLYLVCPSLGFGPVARKAHGKGKGGWTTALMMGVFFYGAWALLIIQAITRAVDAPVHNLHCVAWACLTVFAVMGALLRCKVRSIYGIEGDLIGDFFAMSIWPSVIFQLREQLEQPVPVNKETDSDSTTPPTHAHTGTHTGKVSVKEV